MAETFKILFEINILHHFFLNKGLRHFEGMKDDDKLRQLANYDVHNFLHIKPTLSCQSKLSGYKLLFKKTFTGFIIGTPTENGDDTKPFSDFVEKDQFSFEVRINDSYILNYSNLSLKESPGQIYYFNNRDKADFQFPNITSIAKEFDSSQASSMAGDGDPNTFAYYPGDLVIDDASDPAVVFIAIRSTNSNTSVTTDWREDVPASVYDGTTSYTEGDIIQFETGGKHAIYRAIIDSVGIDPTVSANWVKVMDLPLYYVNQADSIRTLGPLFTYDVGSPSMNVNFEIKDTYGHVVKSKNFLSTADNMSHVLDLRSYAQGQYHFKITNNADSSTIEEFDFYLLPERGSSGLLGVIEIFSGDDLGDFSLVQGDNTMNSPEYILRIMNRSTVWRYVGSKDRLVQHETDFNPLTSSGNIEVMVSGNTLPNPSVNIIKPEPQQYYSDIYL